MKLESVRKSVDNSCCFRPLNDGSTRIIFEITRRCNLKCKHCMAPTIGKCTELSDERIKRLMNELSENNISKIMITGGEPLLVDNIFDYIKMATDNKILVDLNTNLTLLDEIKAEKLKDSGVREVTTSIDGDEIIHCNIRNNGFSYQKTINAIKLLVNKGISVDVVCTVMKTNLHKLKDVAEICNKLGVSSLTFSGLILEGRAQVEESVYDLQEVKKIIDNLRSTSKIPIRTVRMFNNDFSICHKGIDMIGIDYLGNIHPCLQDKIKNPLNINQHSLRECIDDIRNKMKKCKCTCFLH